MLTYMQTTAAILTREKVEPGFHTTTLVPWSMNTWKST